MEDRSLNSPKPVGHNVRQISQCAKELVRDAAQNTSRQQRLEFGVIS